MYKFVDIGQLAWVDEMHSVQVGVYIRSRFVCVEYHFGLTVPSGNNASFLMKRTVGRWN